MVHVEGPDIITSTGCARDGIFSWGIICPRSMKVCGLSDRHLIYPFFDRMSNQGDMLVLCYHLGSRSEVSYKQNRCGSGWICEHRDRFPTNNTWTTSYSWNQAHNSQNQEHIFNWRQQFIRDKKQRKMRFLKKLNLFGKTFYHNIYTRLFKFIFWNWNADIG